MVEAPLAAYWVAEAARMVEPLGTVEVVDGTVAMSGVKQARHCYCQKQG